MRQTLAIALPAALLLGGVWISYNSNPEQNLEAGPGLMGPVGQSPSVASTRTAIPWDQKVRVPVQGPSVVRVSDIPAGVFDPARSFDSNDAPSRIESPLPDEEVEALRRAAMLLPPSEALLGRAPDGASTLVAGTAFDSLDYTDCCGGGQAVPPDPHLGVGLNHIVAVINVAFAIYDKTGAVVSGPTTFESFFAGTAGYAGRPFDPSVLYDESADRWFMGVDSDNTDYCFAVTTSADPTATWNRYCFPGDVGGALFDYPQAGVGADAVMVGSNQFTPGSPPTYLESRVFAIDKTLAYAGQPLGTVNSWSLGRDATPQPANLHGWIDASWPPGSPDTVPHWVMTDQAGTGCRFNLWTLIDPLADPPSMPTRGSNIDLCAYTGVAAGMPIDWPQANPGLMLQANDWRTRKVEYRNGDLWMTDSIACNPGGESVNCVRWARIDPGQTMAPTGNDQIMDAGVIASEGEHRTFPNISANRCDDAVVGYSKGTSTMFPGAFVTGRESSDPAGTMQTELVLKSGEEVYDAYDAGPHRWGDYTGMTIDPDGVTFWYLGQYSKTTGAAADWGNYVGSFNFSACEPVIGRIFADGFESGDVSAWSVSNP